MEEIKKTDNSITDEELDAVNGGLDKELNITNGFSNAENGFSNAENGFSHFKEEELPNNSFNTLF